MTIVDAHHFPGPALWQGLMLILLPVWFFGLYWRRGKYLLHFSLGYAIAGVLFFIIIVEATH